MNSYKAHWQSPSNIALVKYWGKKEGVQLPANASISFTLSNCHTRTALELEDSDSLSFSIRLNGEDTPSFEPKLKQFIDRISPIFPFAAKGRYTVDTYNSFPHSSGIASSASGMSAMALCICDIAIQKGLLEADQLFDTASNLARLGSGSAARSLYGPLASWGDHKDFPQSSDEVATQFKDVHPVFRDYCDTILLVHKGQKDVSSTVGHGLIDGHPFSQQRFAHAQQQMTDLKRVLQTGDLEQFVKIVEGEALMLHALMMTSDPSFILMHPQTLSIIQEIQKVRKEKGVKWCFTLDAGANVHFLYPKADEPKALDFVDNVLKQFCQEEAYICDQIGEGPIKLN